MERARSHGVNRLRVLIAEDHEDTREMYSTYLTSQGLRGVVAEDVMPTS